MTDNLEQLEESTQDSAPTSPESTNESASETVRETINRVLAGQEIQETEEADTLPEPPEPCLLYTSPSPRDLSTSRMPSSA